MTHTHPCRIVEQLGEGAPHEWHVDGERRLIRDLVLVGPVSRNGYRYSEEALQGAVPLYDRKPVFLDHSPRLSRPHDRSTRDLVGTIVNPRFADGRVRGDIEVLDTEAGRTFLALTQSDSPAVGMSQVVMAERDASGEQVVRIREVVSVDAVIFPATTSGFREHVTSPLPGSVESLLHLIDSRLPEHVSRLVACGPSSDVRRAGLFSEHVLAEVGPDADGRTQHYIIPWRYADHELVLSEAIAPLSAAEAERWTTAAEAAFPVPEEQHDIAQAAAMGALRERCAELEQQLHAYRERHSAARRIDDLLSGSGLPAYAITPAFREQLVAATDDEQRRQLIAERRQLLRHAAAASPRSIPRSESSDATTSQALVQAIKSQRRA